MRCALTFQHAIHVVQGFLETALRDGEAHADITLCGFAEGAAW